MKLPSRAVGLSALFDWAKEVVSKAILDGRLIEDITVSTTDLTVTHRMGRIPRGAIVVKASGLGNIRLYQFTADTITTRSASGTQTVSIWIF